MGQIEAFTKEFWQIGWYFSDELHQEPELLPRFFPYSCAFHREVEQANKPHKIEVFSLLVQVSLQSMKVSEQRRFSPDKTKLRHCFLSCVGYILSKSVCVPVRIRYNSLPLTR